MVKLTDDGGQSKTVEGVTHVHQTPAKTRTLYMHFVRLDGLHSRANYSYTVGVGSATSSSYHFRAPPTDNGETRLAMFGDMGVYAWNNMGNLKSDCDAGVIDAVVHIGDHAYNEGDADERRGDGYMNMYQPIVTQCPWMPIVGNHEYYSGEYLSRFLDQNAASYADATTTKVAADGVTDTAASALGALLSKATWHGASVGGAVPSNTSRWFSVDYGLVHLIAVATVTART